MAKAQGNKSEAIDTTKAPDVTTQASEKSETANNVAADVPTPAETATPTLGDVIIGDTVQYVIPRGPSKGQKRPALVTHISNDSTVDLFVFFSPTKDGELYRNSPVYIENVAQTQEGQEERGTFVTII